MSTAFSKLQRAAFFEIQFPVRRMTVKGSLRYHVHEFPHAAGGAFENLERKLYEIHMTAPFMQRFRAYPNLWPKRLNDIRTLCETGQAGPLVIPTIGTIRARCVEWPEEMDAKVQSGVVVDFTFIEDQPSANLVSTIVSASEANVASATDAYNAELIAARASNTGSLFGTLSNSQVVAAASGGRGFTPDILDVINDVAQQVFALKDQFDLEGQLLTAKVDRLAGLIEQADATVVGLQQPENYSLLDSLRNLWAANNQLAKDIQGQRAPLAVYPVPMVMSVSEVSVRLYGDNSQAVTLMQMNPIDDVLRIPVGTRIKYYPADTISS